MPAETVKIDLHCHSVFSDGALTPFQIARHCAEQGVRFAALTDHNTIDGLDAFESGCERHGVGFISGLELSTIHGYKEIHLLCYGFDRADSELTRVLTALKGARALNNSVYAGGDMKTSRKIIEIIHQAGGITLLAHPLTTEPDPARLEQLVKELRALGMDGIEAWHADANPEQQELLRNLAAREKCITSGGTDHHGIPGINPGVDIPSAAWKIFRDYLTNQRKNVARNRSSRQQSGRSPDSGNGFGKIKILIPLVLPALAAIVLFTIALFGYFLPRFEEALLERKRETIMELTRTVWSMLDEFEKQVQDGQLTPGEAREQAVEKIRFLRYGREGKDYFWLQDLSPKMIMHPYRNDLEGQNLADFRDLTGTRIFTVFADKVREDGAGYVDYVWQWKDDPSRLEAKESYIRLFEPWEWIIGTGLYINDVHAEIRTLERSFIQAMLTIITILTILLLIMLRNGLRSERLRFAAEKSLHESNTRYATLVQATAEGVLFVRNHRCVYANPVFLEMAACEAEELPLLDWQELFPMATEHDPVTSDGGEYYSDALLRRRDGTVLKCRIALKGIPEDETGGFVVLVRRAEENDAKTTPAADSLLKRLLNLPSTAAEDVAQEIARADTLDQVAERCRRTPDLVRSTIESGASPTAVAGMIASITDSATIKSIELVQAEIGPAPVPFAFVTVGSQGRREQTLFTDQDNIIIYDPPDNRSTDEHEKYFAELAGRVCENLAQAGYRHCKGLLMASNPKWRRPIEKWRDIFSHWIRKAEGQEAMDFVTFFDLRCVWGQEELVRILRAHIQEELARAPWFFIRAAQNAMQFKTPLRIFGNIVSTGRSTEKTGCLDLKAAMMPIVCFARLHALRKNLVCTPTPERLTALCDRGMLLPSRCHNILTAFETLLRMRLRHQSEMMRQGNAPDNLINPTWLGHIDEAVLKECFREIDRIQEDISREFFDGMAER